MTCWKPASPPGTRTPPPRWPWTGPTWSPSPGHRTAAPKQCADPEASWGHRNSNLPGPKGETVLRLLPVRRHHDAAKNTAPPCPSWPGGSPSPSCHADPVRALAPVLTRMPGHGITARRHPRRLRLRPPRRRRLGPPAPRRRRPAGPGPAPARPRPPGHPRRRDHRQREPLLPRHPPPAAAPRATAPRRHPRRHRRPRHRRPPNSPGTNSAGSPPMTPTATTASPAPPPWASSAARSGPAR